MIRPRFPRRPPMRRAHPALRALRQAHRLMETGQYAQAYPILKRLADGAAERGMLVRAAQLYLQAGHARLKMGSGSDAAALARQAIETLVRAGRAERANALLARAIQALKDAGYHDEAVGLRAEVAALTGESRVPAPSVRRGVLPTKCPSCNGPVRPDEVEWIDERTAECAYCGSVVQTEA